MNSLINTIKANPYDEVQKLTIQEMESLITFLRDKFFNDESVVSDEIYDLIVDFLTLKDPKNKILKLVGAKINSKERIKLDYYLGSMDKIKPDSNKIEKWITKYPSPYIVTDKLDGVSALLIYKMDKTISLNTRGTATHGLDISKLLKYLNVPTYSKIENYVKSKKIKSSNKSNLMSFRGELIISKKEFDDNWASKKSNARNTVSGLVNSKTVDPKLAKSTTLVIYEIVDPLFTMSQQLKISKDLGFETVDSKKFDKIDAPILSEYLVSRKKKSKYVIDGIIVTNDKENKRSSTGNPDYAFAYKDILEDQKAESEILDVEWNLSKDGYLNPIVLIKPVEIGGVTISRITAYNAKYVVDNKIGKGAQIELIRSGDVIPKILKVIKPSKNVKLPDGEWSWNETKVDIISKNLNSKEVQVKNNHYFFSQLDTKGLGLKVVEKLYESGIKTILQILEAKKDDFIEVDGFKEKSSQNLVESIKKAMTNNNEGVELYDLMSASNKLVYGMGSERCKLILENIPDLLSNHKKWTKKEFIDKIKEIPGFEEKTSQMFVDNFKNFVEFYNSIKDHITIKKSKKKVVKSKLNGKIVVISGFRDKDLENKLKDLDVEVKNSVSKNTNFLVVKDDDTISENTGKVAKANELGIKIMTKKNFIKNMVNN